MQKQVAVVIPYYHSRLSETEQISLRQCLKKLYRYPTFLVVPEAMQEECYPAYDRLRFRKVPSQWLGSVSAYNRMMLCLDFYQMFAEYQYILVYQLDAFVFCDRLREFCGMGYDYIGAPWPFGARNAKGKNGHKLFVGNGGLSLRNVSAFTKVLKKKGTDFWELQEDIFWSHCNSEGFRVAPKETALRFSIEEPAEDLFALNQKQLPFGCHAWIKWSFYFWRPFIEKEGYQFSEEFVTANDRYYKGTRSDIEVMPVERIDEVLKEMVKSKRKRLCIWGAGNIGKKWIVALRCAGWSIKCVDSEPARQGEYFWDVSIESPDTLKKETEKILIIIAVKNKKHEIANLLRQMEQDLNFYYSDLLQMFENHEEEKE